MSRINKILCSSLFLLMSCTPKGPQGAPRIEGQNVGNGGDPLPKLFERARAHSIRILEEVKEIQPSAGTGGHSDKELREWFQLNRVALRDDVRTTPPYLWRPSNPNFACGLTGSSKHSEIYLSYEHCRGISTVRDAAVHIIGESVHHFGIRDDAFTAAMAIAIADAWDQIIGASTGALETRLMFEQGRIHASEVVLRIQPRSIPAIFGDLHSPEQQTWLMESRERLASELSQSRLVWMDGELSAGSDPEEKCISTAFRAGAEIELSYSGCSPLSTSREKSGQLLLTSAIFHLRGDRAEARRLAAVAYASWFNMGHPEKAHWLTLPPHSPKTFDVYGAVWTGTEMLVWSQYMNRVSLYDPRHNLWKHREADASRVHQFRKGENPLWVQGKLVIFGDCYKSEEKTGAGVVFDPTTNLWTPMSAREAPQERWFGSGNVLHADGKLVLIGGAKGCHLESEFEGMPNSDFATYDPTLDKWNTRIIEGPSPLSRTGQTVVSTGKELIVWGGRTFSEEENDFTMHNDGAIFDFQGNELRKLPMPKAPRSRGWAQSVWAAGQLVLIGGFAEGDRLGRPYKRALLSDGAIYHLAKDEWVPMNLTGAPKLDADKPFRLVWIGNEVLFVGNVMAYFNPVRNSWRSSDRTFTPLLENPYGAMPTVFWTGVEAILWDVWAYGERLSGYAYYP